MPEFMYDLLIGHEVGHALVTPLGGLHDATCNEALPSRDSSMLSKMLVTRLVKQRYPALSSHSTSVQSIIQKDFFGVKDRDPATFVTD